MSAWTQIGTWTVPSGNRVSVRTRCLPDGNWYGDVEWTDYPSPEDVGHYATVVWPEIFDRMYELTGTGVAYMVPHS